MTRPSAELYHSSTHSSARSLSLVAVRSSVPCHLSVACSSLAKVEGLGMARRWPCPLENARENPSLSDSDKEEFLLHFDTALFGAFCTIPHEFPPGPKLKSSLGRGVTAHPRRGIQGEFGGNSRGIRIQKREFSKKVIETTHVLLWVRSQETSPSSPLIIL